MELKVQFKLGSYVIQWTVFEVVIGKLPSPEDLEALAAAQCLRDEDGNPTMGFQINKSEDS